MEVIDEFSFATVILKLPPFTSGPLELVKCFDASNPENTCGLVQLKHSYDSNEMYGENYGYRSGLNQSMVNHLHSIVTEIRSRISLKENDIVIDIGGNDSTLLQAYPNDKNLQLTVIDPTGNKFKKYYPSHIGLIADFFNAKNYFLRFSDKARVVTSISMFYDLENPLEFVKDIHDVLADDGIWVFEQSYLPLMVETTSYDTICHEHLEYYCLKQIQWMCAKVGFRIIDVVENEVNGGSFRVTVAKENSSITSNEAKISDFSQRETAAGYHKLEVYEKFREAVFKHKDQLIELLKSLHEEGKKIFGYGASTKGNVLLQFCGIGEKDIHCIAEVNEDKFGAFTPNTLIPIISEEEAKAGNPDYFLVLPWHFRKGIIKRETSYLASGGKLIFPLPKVEIVSE